MWPCSSFQPSELANARWNPGWYFISSLRVVIHLDSTYFSLHPPRRITLKILEWRGREQNFLLIFTGDTWWLSFLHSRGVDRVHSDNIWFRLSSFYSLCMFFLFFQREGWFYFYEGLKSPLSRSYGSTSDTSYSRQCIPPDVSINSTLPGQPSMTYCSILFLYFFETEGIFEDDISWLV